MTNDQYSQGRWGTGTRPVGTGPAQSAWDQGAAARRQQQETQRQQAQQQSRHAQQQRDEYNKNYGPNTPNGASLPASEDSEAAGGIMLIASIGAFVFLCVAVWNFVLMAFPSTGGIIGTALDFSPWAVGVVALGVGIRIQEILTTIAMWVLAAMLLFFGAAIVHGIFFASTGS
ncbi:hypothetical protein [Hyphococcus lacteus]|uniref:Uncharacterized protein n=1 Tax=Hyphococcus lacteus TaxID=3143536 RepID=A0ABV3Z1S6_9PROT